MATRLKCRCGRVVPVEDEASEGAVVCPGCERTLAVPPPVPQEEAAEPGENACPHCQAPLDPEAHFCVRCGYNVHTGLVTAIVTAEPEEPEPPAFVFPTRLVVKLAVLAGVLVLGWLYVAAPLIAHFSFERALGPMAEGNLKESLARFEDLRSRIPSCYRPAVELRLAQLRLEQKLNTGAVLGQAQVVSTPDMMMLVEPLKPEGGAFLYQASILNQGDEPLTLREQHFYLRGAGDITFVSGHTDNSVDGVTIEAGKSGGGVIAFRNKPVQYAQRRVGLLSVPCHFLIYNNGASYAKTLAP